MPSPRLARSEVTQARRIGAALEGWAADNLRDLPWRHWSDGYRVTVTEVLLQQTAASKVAAFLDDWLVAYPDWISLASASVSELTDRLRPLGLHRRRAATLHRLALSVLESPAMGLEERPGIGQYIARAVNVSLAGSVEAMVDVNFVRVVRRAFEGPWMADYRYDPRLQAIAMAVVLGADDPKVVNWSVLDLAASICKPRRPSCGACPIMQECRTGRSWGANRP